MERRRPAFCIYCILALLLAFCAGSAFAIAEHNWGHNTFPHNRQLLTEQHQPLNIFENS